MMRNWKREEEWKRTDEFGKSGREKFFIKTLQTPKISYNRVDFYFCCPGLLRTATNECTTTT